LAFAISAKLSAVNILTVVIIIISAMSIPSVVIAELDPAIHDAFPQTQSVRSFFAACPYGCPGQARA
jgi:hypothetical protein